MFGFLLTKQNLLNFDLKANGEDMIFEVIPEGNLLHYTLQKESVFLFYFIQSGDTYIWSSNHPEFPKSEISEKDILEIIKRKDVFVFNKNKINHILKDKINNNKLIDLDIIHYLSYNEKFNVESIIKPHNYEYLGYKEYNKCTPILKLKEDFLNKINKYFTFPLNLYFRKAIYSITYKFLSDLSYQLYNVEKEGIHIDTNIFNEFFKDKSVYINNNIFYSSYNIFTSTGRPTNTFGGINLSALNKTNGVRKMITPRENNKLIVFDFRAFQPRLIGELINHKFEYDFDVYSYFCNVFFPNEIQTTELISKTKNKVFQMVYGERYDYDKSNLFFKRLNDYIEKINIEYNENKLTAPVYKKPILKSFFGEVKPHTIFNYILQGYETEVMYTIVKNTLQYLKQTNSKLVLINYDSLIIDFDDKTTDISLLKDIITNNKQYQVRGYEGKNFNDLTAFN